MTKRKTLVLFDGHALLHRGFHAIPHLSNSEGIPTNGVYGFTTMLLKALSELKPDFVAVGWDLPGPTFRHKRYKDYKGTRAKMDENLVPQIELTSQLIKAFNIPLVHKKGYEADDVIGTLASKYSHNLNIIIVTGDMDELQLVDRNVEVYTLRRGFSDTVIYNQAEVEKKYGVSADNFVAYKALKGDSSDNIPGVAGIGDKTAANLVAQYNDLDTIYKNLDNITPSIRAKLEQGRELAYLSYDLSQIETNLKLDFDISAAKLNDYDRSKVHELFAYLGFRSLLSKLPNSNQESIAQTDIFHDSKLTTRKRQRAHLKKVKYITIDNENDLINLVKKLQKAKNFAFDTETDSLDIINANLVGMSFCATSSEAYYVPLGHKQGKQIDISKALKIITPILESKSIGKIGHNIKYDYQILQRYGVSISPITGDTMVMAYLLNPAVRALSLSELAFNELGIEMIDITELIGEKGKNQKTFDQIDIAEATTYAAEDADMAWRLWEKLGSKLEKFPKVQQLAADMEWPLISVLAHMEIAGIKLDDKFLLKYNAQITKKLKTCEDEIYKYAGQKFNIGSTLQLKEILFSKLKIQTQNLKKIKTGISTAASELEKLRGVHPIIDLIFEYREITKLKNTYVDTLPKLVNPTTGRIHTNYNQTIAQTGRLSSTNPNLQNIPIRTPLGEQIRKAFVAPPARKLVSADYSQIELRLAAALSKDKGMISAFVSGADIHVETAALLFDIKPDQVSKAQRYAAKTINFGILYGMSPHGLSVATGMEYKQAKEFIDKYFEIRATLASYIENLKTQAHHDLYTQTIFGRRRPCPEVRSKNFIVRSSAERAAVNMPLQGTAADIMKLAMIKLASKLPPQANIILQIHDELIVECNDSQVAQITDLMRDCMENIHKFNVPIEVSTSSGDSWGTLK